MKILLHVRTHCDSGFDRAHLISFHAKLIMEIKLKNDKRKREKIMNLQFTISNVLHFDRKFDLNGN